MPHHFVDRPRIPVVFARSQLASHDAGWQMVNAAAYLAGGLLFMWGSVLFFPAFSSEENLGAWIFIAGSALYLLVTGHDVIEVRKHRSLMSPSSRWDRLEAVSALSYLLGTLWFIAGSVCFLSSVDRVEVGACCFILGSMLFIVGATIDALAIVRAPGPRILQLMNLTALTFVTGSVLFLVASIPYLFTFDDASDEGRVDALVAGQYLWGSLLFFLGGIFDYRRARTYSNV